MSDTMNLYGVNPDGSTKLIGTALQTPSMKITEIVTSHHGYYDPVNDCNEAADAHHMMHQLLHWLKTTGQLKEGLQGVQAIG